MKRIKKRRQKRSLQTEQAIIEATQKILNESDSVKINTNKIAETAGVSIGSLYQYFPNKEAIYIKIIEKHFSKQVVDISNKISESKTKSFDKVISVIVKSTLENALEKPIMIRNLILLTPKEAYNKIHSEVLSQANILADNYLQTITPNYKKIDNKVSLLIVSTVDAIATKLCFFDSKNLSIKDWENEITAMIISYIKSKK